MKFKAGDRVRCLKGSHGSFTSGHFYKVKGYHDEWKHDALVELDDNGGTTNGLHEGCFELANETTDVVNNPAHYTKGKIQVLDFIEDQKLEFHEAQVLKYVVRAKHKGNELQDLKKAKFYLDRKIGILENADKN